MNPLLPQTSSSLSLDQLWKQLENSRKQWVFGPAEEKTIAWAQALLEYFGLNASSDSAMLKLFKQRKWSSRVQESYLNVCDAYAKILIAAQNHPNKGPVYQKTLNKLIRSTQKSMLSADPWNSSDQTKITVKLVHNAYEILPKPDDILAFEKAIFQATQASWQFGSHLPHLFKFHAVTFCSLDEPKTPIWIPWAQALVLWKASLGESHPEKFVYQALFSQQFPFSSLIFHFTPLGRCDSLLFTLFPSSSFCHTVRIWSLLSALTFLFGKQIVDKRLRNLRALCKSLVSAINFGKLTTFLGKAQRILSLHHLQRLQCSKAAQALDTPIPDLSLYNAAIFIKRWKLSNPKPPIDQVCEVVRWIFSHNVDPTTYSLDFPSSIEEFYEPMILAKNLFLSRTKFDEAAFSLFLAFAQRKKQENIDPHFCIKVMKDFLLLQEKPLTGEQTKELFLHCLAHAVRRSHKSPSVKKYLARLMQKPLPKAPFLNFAKSKTCLTGFWACVANPNSALLSFLEEMKARNLLPDSLLETLAFLQKALETKGRKIFQKNCLKILERLSLLSSPEKSSAKLDHLYSFCCSPLILQNDIELFAIEKRPGLYQVLKKIAPNLRVRQKIGSGGYGDILVIDHFVSDASIVLKIPRRLHEKTPGLYIDTNQRGGDALALSLKHSHLLHPTGLIVTNDCDNPAPSARLCHTIDWKKDAGSYVLGSIFPYQEAVSMQLALDLQGKFSPKHVIYFLLQLTDAVSYLHSAQIVHFDIKPANLLMKKGNALDVIDFDTLIERAHTGNFPLSGDGTPPFQAPEWHFSKKIENLCAADMYSVGICFYYFLTGKLPAATKKCNFREHYGNVYKKMIEEQSKAVIPLLPPEELDPLEKTLYKLIYSCLLFDPTARPTAKKLHEQLKACQQVNVWK